MSALTTDWLQAIEQLPVNSVVTLHNVDWEEYEDLLEKVGESSGLRTSYDRGTLRIMTLSSEHEAYVRFIEKLFGIISLRRRINIRSFGSSTMRKKKKAKGLEPDACFYVQSASQIGKRMTLDFEIDPPPDIAIEVDLNHESGSKFPIYAALGVSEIWHFDGQRMTIHLLEGEEYRSGAESRALPVLNSQLLTEFLTQLSNEGELDAVIAFDDWLQALQG